MSQKREKLTRKVQQLDQRMGFCERQCGFNATAIDAIREAERLEQERRLQRERKRTAEAQRMEWVWHVVACAALGITLVAVIIAGSVTAKADTPEDDGPRVQIIEVQHGKMG